MLKPLAVLAAAVLSSVTSGIALTVTAERPVAPPSVVAAPYEQSSPSLASNGVEFVVTWLDQRASRDDSAYGPTALYAAHVDNAGKITPPLGRKLGFAYSFAVATNGSGFVVAYQQADGIYTLLLSEEGTPVAAPKLVLPVMVNTTVQSIAWNGESLLLAVGQSQPQGLKLLLLNRDGTLRQPIAVESTQLDAAIVVLGGVYHVIHSSWHCPGNVACTTSIVDDVVDQSHASTSSHTLTGDLGQHFRLAAAASDAGILVAWVADQAVDNEAQEVLGYTVAGSGSTVMMTNARAAAAPTSCYCGAGTPSVTWDGGKFLIAFTRFGSYSSSSGPPSLLALRVAADGAQLDMTPFTISTHVTGAPAFARSDTAELMTWPDGAVWRQSDLLARLAPSVDSLLTDPSFRVALSSASQQQADITSFGEKTVAVWRETGEGTSIRASIQPISDSGPASLTVVAPAGTRTNHDPAAAAAGEVTLVSWIEDDGSSFRVLARRLGADGTLLDPTATVLESNAINSWISTTAKPAIATDGHDFLVAWAAADLKVHAARITRDGTVLNLEPLIVSRPLDQFTGVPYSLNAVWTGNVYLVAWLSDPNHPGILGAPPIAAFAVSGARITREGTILDETKSLTYFAAGGAAAPLTLARASDRIVLAWDNATNANPPCVATLTLTPDGIATRDQPRLSYCGMAGSLKAAAIGDEVLVVGRNASGRIVGLRFNAEGEPLLSASIPLSPEGADAYDPAVTVVDGRFAIAYSRTADGVYGGVGRVFTVLTIKPIQRRAVSR